MTIFWAGDGVLDPSLRLLVLLNDRSADYFWNNHRLSIWITEAKTFTCLTCISITTAINTSSTAAPSRRMFLCIPSGWTLTSASLVHTHGWGALELSHMKQHLSVRSVSFWQSSKSNTKDKVKVITNGKSCLNELTSVSLKYTVKTKWPVLIDYKLTVRCWPVILPLQNKLFL